MKTVTFSAEKGDIDYGITYLNSAGSDAKAFDFELPDRVGLTLELGADHIVDVTYYPTQAVDVMMNAAEKLEDLSVLPEDTIRIAVTFTDGATAEAAIRTSFDKDGNLRLSYQE